MKSLRDAWVSYRERVVPADAGQHQVLETQRAFYAGAASMWDLVTGGLSAGTEPQPEDLERMDSLHRELVDYVASQGVARGGVQ
jgi:hypothetical protein